MVKRGRPALTQAQKVFNAVRRGAQSPSEIAAATKIPAHSVNTILYSLRGSGSVKGYAGEMKAVRAPKAPLGGRK